MSKPLTFKDMNIGDVFLIKHTKIKETYTKVPGYKSQTLNNYWYVDPDIEIHEVLEKPPQIGDKYASKAVPFIEYEYRGEFDGGSVLKRTDCINSYIHPRNFPSAYIRVAS